MSLGAGLLRLMTLRIPNLAPLLGDQHLAQMHTGALDVLQRVGFRVDDPNVVARLITYPGVRAADGRVCLDPGLVEERIAPRPACTAPEEPAREPGRIHLTAGCCASHVVDPETLSLRPVTTPDLVAAARLIHGLAGESISGSVPGFPQDVPPDLRPLGEFKIGSEHIESGGSFVAPCSLEALEFIHDMHRVMGRPFGLPLYVLSPLRLAGDSLDAILHFGDRLDHLSVGSMPTMGATAPVHFVDAFVQAIAEVIGAVVLLGILAPGIPITFSIMAYCVDMGRGSIVYGSPEQNLCDLIGMAVNAYYGIEHMSTRSIRSSAQRPGLQAAAEKAASAATGALAGSRRFAGAGMLSVDEVWSPEQLIIDREIADYAHRLARGFDFAGTGRAIEVIADATMTGEFLSHPSTLAGFRSVYWMPRLFRHGMLRERHALGTPEAWQEARCVVRRVLEKPGFQLDAGRKRELRRIYACAQRALA